jgi:hypothetical protein
MSRRLRLAEEGAGEAAQKDSSVCPPTPAWVRKCRIRHGSRLVEQVEVPFGPAAGQPVTVNVADATVPLWRPLAWKVSFRPG